MSNLIVPPSCRPVQISEKERVFVLVHKITKRILCFCRDDPFARSFQGQGYELIALMHAHDYDLWAKRFREQTANENEAQDFANLERENSVRQTLRKQLRERLGHCTSGAQRQAVESALHCLDALEKKRQRYRKESFMLAEAYDDSKNPGEELVNKIMAPKQ